MFPPSKSALGITVGLFFNMLVTEKKLHDYFAVAKKNTSKLLCSKWVNLLCISNANVSLQKGRLTFWG